MHVVRMKRGFRSAARLALTALILAAAACASASGGSGVSPARQLASGLAALENGDFDAARDRLATVLRECGAAPLGEQAVLLMASGALDPRVGDTDLAAAVTAAYLAQPRGGLPGQRVAESLYLLALYLGAHPDRSVVPLPAPEAAPAECHERPPTMRSAKRNGTLPALAETPLPEQMAALRTELEAVRAELARVQETLRP